MSERDYAPLSVACVRGLCDKIYDKRKIAGIEIEKMVKDFNDANNTNQIKRLIRVLGQDLMSSTNSNVKNGALMGLSSVAVGLKDCVNYLPELIHPIVASCCEADSRVRYQAAEAMFNVVKIARGSTLPHFPLIFDALGKLAADPEPQVKQGAELLDRLVKDIVMESACAGGAFDLGSFIPLLRERMYTRNACGRQFIISWVSVLDAVPDIDLVPYLPELLDGLFYMLDDPMPEIRRMCEIQLNEFLRSIKKDPSNAHFATMINVLIVHAQSSEEILQFTAITWLAEFVSLAGFAMMPRASGILTAILPCLAYTDDSRNNIREKAATVNFQLSKLIPEEVDDPDRQKNDEEESQLQLPAIVDVLSQLLHHNSVQTKVAVLKWILHLYNKMPRQMFTHTEILFLGLVGSLTDVSDDVVRQSLAVLAEICSCRAGNDEGVLETSPYYYKFLKALLRLLSADDNLLEDRGAFIIRQLCVLLNAEEIYKALSLILIEESDLGFVSTMVDVLNTILLTAAELYDLRTMLKKFDKPVTQKLFRNLYECWCHSPVSLAALCLLTHNYHHCYQLITLFGDLEITVDFLTEIDKLVQLIESPIFAYLRLELLGGNAESIALRGALYGLLMLLPQTEAFHTLRRRLQCTPPPPVLLHQQIDTTSAGESKQTNLDWAKLLEKFKSVQASHREYRLVDRNNRLNLQDKGYS